MTKKTYREDKKKLKEFFKDEEHNLKKVFDDLLKHLSYKTEKIIRFRYSLTDKYGFPGYKELDENSWYSLSKYTFDYTPSWISELFYQGIDSMKYWVVRNRDTYKKTPNKLTKLKRELIKYVDKENINDKSVYLYIHKYFLFEDELYELVTGKSLKEYFLYR